MKLTIDIDETKLALIIGIIFFGLIAIEVLTFLRYSLIMW